ncbi:Uncharacterised protein family C20orf85 [Cinara cedri]|uniref:Uncharacterized protein n=1 Tax=Cinara cedri TaxID=506608 RepID=A0A5E4LZQ3_9HEMI|nr:Uncharacterised protein family C20orf85 [Cinara cedri]
MSTTPRAAPSVSADRNYRRRCEQEYKASDEWNSKWSWMLDINNERNRKINEVKKLYHDSMVKKDDADNLSLDFSRMPSYPDTTYKEVGWLSSLPEFQLEIFGPDVKRWC